MEENVKGVGVPIYAPYGKFLGYVIVNEKLEVSHSLESGYKISREEAEIEKLNREVSGLKRDILHVNNNHHSNLSKIRDLEEMQKWLFLTISIILLANVLIVFFK
jgi:hypothetical protein